MLSETRKVPASTVTLLVKSSFERALAFSKVAALS
jgi:hypothetical protein